MNKPTTEQIEAANKSLRARCATIATNPDTKMIVEGIVERFPDLTQDAVNAILDDYCTCQTRVEAYERVFIRDENLRIHETGMDKAKGRVDFWVKDLDEGDNAQAVLDTFSLNDVPEAATTELSRLLDEFLKKHRSKCE